jgi:hypothetical protein
LAHPAAVPTPDDHLEVIKWFRRSIHVPEVLIAAGLLYICPQSNLYDITTILYPFSLTHFAASRFNDQAC